MPPSWPNDDGARACIGQHASLSRRVISPTYLTQLLDETHRLALETTLEPTTCARMDNIDKLLVGEVEQLLELDTAEGECAERALLLHLSSLCRVGLEIGHAGLWDGEEGLKWGLEAETERAGARGWASLLEDASGRLELGCRGSFRPLYSP